MAFGWFADGMDVEAEVEEGLMIEDVAPVEDEGGVGHAFIDALVVELGEEGPFGEEGNGVGSLGSEVGIGLEDDAIGKVAKIGTGVFEGVGIGEDDLGMLLEEGTGDGEGGAFARVGGVGFEGGAEEGDALAGESVEHDGDHLGSEARLLVFVHFDDLLPIGGDFG